MSAEQMAYQLKQIAMAMNCEATAEAIIRRWEEAKKDKERVNFMETRNSFNQGGFHGWEIISPHEGETLRQAIDSAMYPAASGEKRGL